MQHAREDAGLGSSQASWQGVNLATAAPEEIEAVLSNTILKDFKARLGRIGLEYQTPDRPRLPA